MNKILVVVLAVVVFAVGIGGWFMWQQRQRPSPSPTEQSSIAAPTTPLFVDDTSDWQTYRNEEFGFAAMYPEGFYQKAYSLVDDKNEILLHVSGTTISGPFREHS